MKHFRQRTYLSIQQLAAKSSRPKGDTVMEVLGAARWLAKVNLIAAEMR